MNTCQLCGNQTAEQMFDVLPWGATCAPCVDEIKEARK
jgi:bacterioferritin-associated ferredoxin